LRRRFSNRWAIEGELFEARAVHRDALRTERVFRRSHWKGCRDESGERGFGRPQRVLRRDEGKLSVADLDNGPQGVALRGRPGGHPRRRRAHLELRLLELCARGRFGLTRRQTVVVRLFDIQRDLKTLVDIVRLGGVLLRAGAAQLIEPRAAIEQLKAH
jgi:hypothetical protein